MKCVQYIKQLICRFINLFKKQTKKNNTDTSKNINVVSCKVRYIQTKQTNN